jgi:hypothetical protein
MERCSLNSLKHARAALCALPLAAKTLLRPLIGALNAQIRVTQERIGTSVARDVYPNDWGINEFTVDNGCGQFTCATQTNTMFYMHMQNEFVEIVRYQQNVRLGVGLQLFVHPTRGWLRAQLTAVAQQTGEPDVGWIEACVNDLSAEALLIQSIALFIERASIGV